MATKGKFHIPSAEEMAIDSERITAPKPQSLFSAHRKTVQENIAREKNKSPTKPSSIQSQTESVQSKSAIITKSNECISRPLVQKKDGPTVDTLQTPAPFTSAVTTTSVAGGGLSKENPTKEQNRQEKDAPPRSSNPQALVVSARQRGNPILKSVRNVPWEFGDIVADYQMGPTTCAIFLSLRYHNLNPNYIHERLKQLGHSYNLRVLLVQVDIKDPTHCLKELAKMCILADCTLILAFTPEEAGKYLETFKSFENKPPDLIMEKTEGNYLTKVTETLTAVKSINKTDSSTLLHTFGSMQDIVEATEEDLSFCPGFGPQKAKRLHNIFHEPFLREKKRKTNTVSPTKKKEPSHSPRKS